MSSRPISAPREGVNALVIRSAVAIAIGDLIFGFDTAVISGTSGALEDRFKLNDSGIGLTVAIATVGTIFGALIGGHLANRYGQKNLLFAIGILYALGSLGTAVAWTHAVLLAFRFVGDIGVGLSSVCAPIYTAEIAPARIRGRLVGLVQFNIVLGILLTYLSNYITRQIITDPMEAWRWMLGVMVVSPAIFLFLLFSMPETPRWLMSCGCDKETAEISHRLCSIRTESEEQIARIRQQLAADRAKGSLSGFFSRRYRKVVFFAFIIAMCSQLSGINATLYYALKVLEKAGVNEDQRYLMSVAVGIMSLIATMAALMVIDKIGRRSLMIVGSIGHLLSLGFLMGIIFMCEGHFDSTSSMLVFVGLLFLIAAHAFGQGSVIWAFISEISPNKVRGLGQSLGSLTHRVFAAITTFAFSTVIGSWGGGFASLIFFVCMCGQLFWVPKMMPETKGVPLEEMESKLGLK